MKELSLILLVCALSIVGLSPLSSAKRNAGGRPTATPPANLVPASSDDPAKDVKAAPVKAETKQSQNPTQATDADSAESGNGMNLAKSPTTLPTDLIVEEEDEAVAKTKRQKPSATIELAPPATNSILNYTDPNAISITTVAGSGLIINATFDSSITSNANSAAIEATINQAIGIYQSLFTDPVTISILFRYSTTAPDGSPINSGNIAQSNYVVYSFSWNTYINALIADAKTTNDTTANASLPASALSTSIRLSSANGRAVSLNTPPAMFANASVGAGGPYDGIVTLNSAQPLQFTRPPSSSNYDALRSTEHEIDEVLGFGSFLNTTSSSLKPQDLFSWSAPGARNTTSSGSRYFSINSGNTNIVNFSQDSNGDFGDWLSGFCPQANPYAQNAFSCRGQSSDVTTTSPEGINLDVIGYDLITAIPPTNDNFANAQVISGNSGSVTGSNVNATKEAGEPNHAGNSGGASVWYQWQAPASGSVTITTAGSNFDTLMGVYTGNSVNALTTIASNDDENTAGGIFTSKVVFNAVGGTTYRIAVDGFSGATGNISLSWNLTSCSYSISPTAQSFTSGAGTGSVNVTTTSGCAWSAVSNSSFITITSGASGTGNGTVSYAVAANGGSARTGTLTIAGQTFTVSQSGASTPTTVQLSATSYSVNEGGSFATLTVNRTGDLSSPATVKYATSDATDVNFNCNPNTVGQVKGFASRKCDYHLAVGRLRFAAGESANQIVVSIVDDVYVEGPETFTFTLSNPTGATLGANTTATITITDNDTTPGAANPIDGTRFYVRQLYVDLLSREPDPAGFAGWIHRIDFCGQPGEAPPPCDRVTVGGDGFLRSAEFFDRQFFVLRLYRTGFGRIPQYSEVGDLAYVSGFLTSGDLELNKQELVADIMSRSEFSGKYNGLSNTGFVDALLQTAVVTVPQSIHDGWVAALNVSSKTRAQVYREMSERQEVNDKYLHEAQVVSCYYGFFTRNPDAAYFNFLQRLDSGQINLGDLANAFINAAEYRQRFAP